MIHPEQGAFALESMDHIDDDEDAYQDTYVAMPDEPTMDGECNKVVGPEPIIEDEDTALNVSLPFEGNAMAEDRSLRSLGKRRRALSTTRAPGCLQSGLKYRIL